MQPSGCIFRIRLESWKIHLQYLIFSYIAFVGINKLLTHTVKDKTWF